MPINVPKIDDRNYDQILAETLARIPVHTPEWTNFNDSDPGVTLLQLFAFMTDNLLYRSNLIPERSRAKFLKLLRVDPRPASAARGMVVFSNKRSPLEAVTIPAGLEVFAGQVPFRTQNGLDVLPVEAAVFYKKSRTEDEVIKSSGGSSELTSLYKQLYTQNDPIAQIQYYETLPLELPSDGEYPTINLVQDTMDGSLWVALLAPDEDLVGPARDKIANKVLTLGVLPALDEKERSLLPGGLPSSEDFPALLYQIPIGGQLPPEESKRTAAYRTLEARSSSNVLSEPGLVQIPLPGRDQLRLWDNMEPIEAGTGDFPPSLEETDLENRIITWVRIRLRDLQAAKERVAATEEASAARSAQFRARISWVGINAAQVEQYARVYNENLGFGSGEPDQVVFLRSTPVIPKGVRLLVGGAEWQETEDLMSAPPEVLVRGAQLRPGSGGAIFERGTPEVYMLDAETGEIRFGSGLNGARPPSGAVIQASYDHGGGARGNVSIGGITRGPNLPAGIKVTNPLPTWGGGDAETVEETERRVSGYLRHRERLVSAEDFLEITRQTPGVDIGRVEVLPLFHPALPNTLAEGVVTVMVIPLYDPLQPDAPEPDRLFLNTVCQHLDPRRVVTTELHVSGPDYIPISVSIGIDVIPGKDIAPVRDAVRDAVRQFLSPLYGGMHGTGWPLGQTVERLQIWTEAARVTDVAKVNQVLLNSDASTDPDRVQVIGLQLPYLVSLSVETGDAPSAPEPPVPPGKIIPVPLIPHECE
jgi:hypothetical protein